MKVNQKRRQKTIYVLIVKCSNYKMSFNTIVKIMQMFEGTLWYCFFLYVMKFLHEYYTQGRLEVIIRTIPINNIWERWSSISSLRLGAIGGLMASNSFELWYIFNFYSICKDLKISGVLTLPDTVIVTGIAHNNEILKWKFMSFE